MGRLAGDSRTYAVRLCKRLKLSDGDPCPTCDKPLGNPDKPPRKTVKHEITIATEHGEDWVSVSTVAGILDKSGALSGWAFNVAIEGALALRETIDFKGWSEEQLKGALKDIGAVPWVKKDRAATRGSEVHTILERLASGEDFDSVKDFIETMTVEGFSEEENIAVRGYATGVIAWWTSHPSTPLLVEDPVWSSMHRTAGTLDLYAQRQRGTVLSDLKTSKDVYDSAVVQLGGYALCINEMIDHGVLDLPRPGHGSIILVRPDGTFEERFVPLSEGAYRNALALYRKSQDIKTYLKEG